MTTGNSNQLFGGSRYITDPRELPVSQLDESTLYLKTALATSVNCSAANAPGFFTSLAVYGAQASVAAPDTYVTVANLVGRGRVYNIITPSNTGAACTPTIRVTRDGTVYTIAPSTTIAATYRAILGALTGQPSINAGAVIGSDIFGPSTPTDKGFVAAEPMVGGFFSPGPSGVVRPSTMENYGMPFLQFEESCLIEFKTSLLASASGDRIGGATFRMLP